MRNQKINWQKVWSIVIPCDASIVPGLGHIVLGMYRRGLIILGLWMGLLLTTPLSPYEVGLIPLFIFWVWQGYEVVVLVRKKHPELPFLIPFTREELRRLKKR